MFISSRPIMAASLRAPANMRYAVPRFTARVPEIISAVFTSASAQNAPVILQLEPPDLNSPVIFGTIEKLMVKNFNLPVAIHLKKCPNLETLQEAAWQGVTSVRFTAEFGRDGNFLHFGEYTKLLAAARDNIRRGGRDILLEAEIRRPVSFNQEAFLGNIEELRTQAGIDSLALDLGTCPGMKKFSEEPVINYDLLTAVREKFPRLFLVLNGGSSLPRGLVEKVNQSGGKIDTGHIFGVSDEILKRLVQLGLNAVSFTSDLDLAYAAGRSNPETILSPAETFKQTAAEILGVVTPKIKLLNAQDKARENTIQPPAIPLPPARENTSFPMRGHRGGALSDLD